MIGLVPYTVAHFGALLRMHHALRLAPNVHLGRIQIYIIFRFRHAEAYLGTICLLTCHDGGIYDVLLVRCVSASCSGPSRCSSAEWDKLRA